MWNTPLKRLVNEISSMKNFAVITPGSVATDSISADEYPSAVLMNTPLSKKVTNTQYRKLIKPFIP
jgi:hypothetical protein